MAEKLGEYGHAAAHDSKSDLGVPGEVGVSISLWGWLERDGERALGEEGIAYDQRARGIRSYV